MRASSSSSRQLEFNFTELRYEQPKTGFGADGPSDSDSFGAGSSVVKFPNFDKLGAVYAASARRAGRINAAHAREEEVRDLLRERSSLLDKKFEGTLSKSGQHRLAYVEWSLDRIEDARLGQDLEALESALNRYEKLLHEIADLKVQVSSLNRGRGKR